MLARGTLSAVLDWYQREYSQTRNDIALGPVGAAPAVFIDNSLLDPTCAEGLFLDLDRLIDPARPEPLRVLSTSKAFVVTVAAGEAIRRPLAGCAAADWRPSVRRLVFVPPPSRCRP
jgi:hypothetical protein